jgi:arylsulfatase A-like enzyme
MAAEGIRFTDGYANSALCSPSRFALATGRYQYRLRGAAEEPLTGQPHVGLPPEHPTIPSLLRDAGYRTGLFGKWHLGFPPDFGPLKSGYQEFFGPLSGGIDYFTHCDPSGEHDLYENEKEVSCRGYLSDLITDRALQFIRSAATAGTPFFASVHYTAPHWPFETRADESLAKEIHGRIFHYDGGSVEIYQTMIRQMDEGIGRLFDVLKASGADANTLVVFTSDNGGERFSDTWPLVGAKYDLLEGGIRVPLIARWPARVPPKQVTNQVAISMDWMPTMLSAAGVAPAPGYEPDGVDLLEVLFNANRSVERDVFWRMKYRDQRAVRRGQWKYLSLEGNEFLYDLSKDARERANLARRYPEILSALRQRYASWEATMPPIPPDAIVSRACTPADLAKPS